MLLFPGSFAFLSANKIRKLITWSFALAHCVSLWTGSLFGEKSSKEREGKVPRSTKGLFTGYHCVSSWDARWRRRSALGGKAVCGGCRSRSRGIRPDGSTPLNTVDEASYCVKCKFFFSFVIFPSPLLVSCNMHFLTTRKNIAFLYSRIPLATFLEEPFIPTNDSYRYMFFALVGWWFPC